MPKGIPMQFFAQVNFIISKISIPENAQNSKITVFQVMTGESQVTMISFTHIHSGLQKILLFQNFQ